MTRAIVFPGQGVQAPGMHAGLDAEAPEVFATASDALAVDVVELCREGSSGAASLDTTRWAQPAIVVCGIAAARALERRGEMFDLTAGHSLGEYTALVVAGSLTVEDAVRLVALRAEAMDRAAARRPGGMVAILRVDRDAVDAICDASGVSLAGDNAPGQLVVSGGPEALELAIARAEGAGAVCRRVDVAGAFHSPAMEPATGELSAALAATPIAAPRLAVFSPTTAGPVRAPDEIRAALVAQLTRPVRFRETLLAMDAAGAAAYCDAGPGTVLAAMIKRTIRGASITSTSELVQAVAS